jgi:HK97 family phage portal protein
MSTDTGSGWAALAEHRALVAPTVQPTVQPALQLHSHTGPLDVTTSNALQVTDAYACVRVLADSVSSLRLHVYRRTPQGRLPAGDSGRAVQLLNRPAPGSTGVDLISHVMVHLNGYGETFVGKYRADSEIVQLGLISPETVHVHLKGQTIVYTISTTKGLVEVTPSDMLHIKETSLDGLRGLSPVTQCRISLGLSSSLQQSAKVCTEQSSKPSGLLVAPNGSSGERLERMVQTWQHRHAGVPTMHRVAVVSGDVKFEPIGVSKDDQQLLDQRELSAREIARMFRVPAWAIDAPTGDSLTSSNVAEQNWALDVPAAARWPCGSRHHDSGTSSTASRAAYYTTATSPAPLRRLRLSARTCSSTSARRRQARARPAAWEPETNGAGGRFFWPQSPATSPWTFLSPNLLSRTVIA